jgi:penicillin-binding protein 1B
MMTRMIDRLRTAWLRLKTRRSDCPDREHTGPQRKFICYGALGLGLVALTTFACIDRSIVHRFEARASSLPSRVFAVPFAVERGDRLDSDLLLEQLQGLGYVEAGGDLPRVGEFQRRGNDWTIFLRASKLPRGESEARLVKLDIRRDRLRKITDLQMRERLDGFSLEPAPLFTFYSDVQEERQLTPIDEIPWQLQRAVEVVEDRRFRNHHGVDLIGIGRAALANLRAGGVVQGGSTITQQLVKNLYGPGKRTFRRKALEAAAALVIELHYGKDAILEAYLNEVYLGQRGPVAVSGVGEASRFFFGDPVGELDLARSALLAGMIRNPGRYNPRRHPEESRERRDLVLHLMREQEVIDESMLAAALSAPLGAREEPVGSKRFPWIEDYLAREMNPIAPQAVPSRAGYSIFTTFDPRIQRAARETLTAGLDRLGKRAGQAEDGGDPLEGAIVVLRPADGAVLAMIGGRDYRTSQFNRAVQARRSPGSTFKPFVFLAGFERALSDSGFDFTVATPLDDAPLELLAGGKPWRPANYDRRFRGTVTVRDALEQSINVPTVRAAMQIGLPDIVSTAQTCGIESALQPIPSLALGTQELSPLELARAYATLANGGWRVRAHGLTALYDRENNELMHGEFPPERVVDPRLAYLVNDVLEGVFVTGTARSAARLGFSGNAAGKTGSSDGLRDAWFVGYTPKLLALVWIGYDDNRSVGLPGGAAALPIWVDLIQRIGVDEDRPFEQPDGIVREKVDPATGQLAMRRCPDSRQEIFVRGTEPVEHCRLHREEKRRGFWRSLIGRR